MTSSIWQSEYKNTTHQSAQLYYGVKNQTLKPFSFCLQSKCKGIWIIYIFILKIKHCYFKSLACVCSQSNNDHSRWFHIYFTTLYDTHSNELWLILEYKELQRTLNKQEKEKTLRQTIHLYYLYFPNLWTYNISIIIIIPFIIYLYYIPLCTFVIYLFICQRIRRKKNEILIKIAM